MILFYFIEYLVRQQALPVAIALQKFSFASGHFKHSSQPAEKVADVATCVVRLRNINLKLELMALQDSKLLL